MKKNGYLRKFIAMFLVFVMLMADSSMTTFADVVGRSVQSRMRLKTKRMALICRAQMM